MNYTEARAYMEEIGKSGSVYGLDSIRSLLEELGNPQKRLKLVHIAGTNGKGSVLAFVSAILTCAGYRTGCYVSPSVFSYREKMQVNGCMVSREEFAALTEEVRAACERMKARGLPQPTVFEAETAAAFCYFVQKGCEIAVLETGLGGTLDATNVAERVAVAVITSVSMDHMGILGDSLEEIAACKAGIIKPGCQAVCLWQKPEVNAILEETAAAKQAVLSRAKTERLQNVCYGLEKQVFTYMSERGNLYKDCVIEQAGTCQPENAIVAIEAAEALRAAGIPVPQTAIREGLSKARWPGRFSVISRRPLVILDGAHNRDGAAQLVRSIEMYLKDRKLIYIMGVFADKEYENILAQTAPLAAHIYTIAVPDNPRALPAKKLAEAAMRWQPHVEAADSIEEAVRRSLAEAQEAEKAGVQTAVVAFGSLSHLGAVSREVRRCLDIKERSLQDGQ